MKRLAPHTPTLNEPRVTPWSNPFGTRRTQPGALPYLSGEREPHDDSIQDLVGRIAQTRVGLVIGPHGSGKTTLLKTLQAQLAEAGQEAVPITIERGSSLSLLPNEGQVLLVDGFERLGYLARLRSLYHLARSPGRSVLAVHATKIAWPIRPPTLVRVRPELCVAERLFLRLTREVATPVNLQDLQSAWRLRRGDLRRVWLDLYALHEQRTRPDRTRPMRVVYSRC